MERESKRGELNTEHGLLQYVLTKGQAKITGFCGRDMELVLPENIEGCPVVCIDKKAFLSNKMLKEISIPESVVRIDDWAFAFCAKLEKVLLPYHRMEIGQGIFKECRRLSQIADECEKGLERKAADVSYLLAAVMNGLDAFYLFDFENAGTDEWLAQWDGRLQSLMQKDDAEGFSKMLLCGEEDYGSRETDPVYYQEQQRREKVRLAMLRLLHDYGLKEPVRAKLREYLLAHRKGQPTEETWKVVLEEYGDELDYYRFLTELGAVTEDNFQAMMEDMGESHAEMKAYLMRYYSECHENRDAFAMFEL